MHGRRLPSITQHEYDKAVDHVRAGYEKKLRSQRRASEKRIAEQANKLAAMKEECTQMLLQVQTLHTQAIEHATSNVSALSVWFWYLGCRSVIHGQGLPIPPRVG